MNPLFSRTAAGLLVVGLLHAAAWADTPRRKHIETTGQNASCLQLKHVRNTQVLDDLTVLFHMRNGDIYRNGLDRPCPGLHAAGGFTYDASGTALCDTDSIRVLDHEAVGATCALGTFEGITMTWGKPPSAH